MLQTKVTKKLFVTVDFVSDVVDPNRDGYVSLQEYMAFMISKETENVQSSEEIEKAFRAITAGDRPYVTKEELYAVSVLPFYLEYFVFKSIKFPGATLFPKVKQQLSGEKIFYSKILVTYFLCLIRQSLFVFLMFLFNF